MMKVEDIKEDIRQNKIQEERFARMAENIKQMNAILDLAGKRKDIACKD